MDLESSSCQLTTQVHKRDSDDAISDNKVCLVDESSSDESEQEHLSDPFWIQNFMQTVKVLPPEEKRDGVTTCLKQPTKKRCRTLAERIARDAEKLQLRRPCDSNTCKLNCCNKISLEERKNILEEFKRMSDHEKKCWVFQRVKKEFVKRKTTETLRRKFTLNYSLKTATGTYPVCKVFFLSTLGFNPKNDRIVTTAIKTAGCDSIAPPHSQRGRKTPPNKIDRDPMRNHILSYVPSISHHRCEEALKDLHLPSEITAYSMHKDYLKKHPDKSCSYKIYLKEMANMNISVAKHKQKQCTIVGAESQNHPDNAITVKQNDSDCNVCTTWDTHLQKMNEAWVRYKMDVEKALRNPDPYHIVRSLNLQRFTSQPAS